MLSFSSPKASRNLKLVFEFKEVIAQENVLKFLAVLTLFARSVLTAYRT